MNFSNYSDSNLSRPARPTFSLYDDHWAAKLAPQTTQPNLEEKYEHVITELRAEIRAKDQTIEELQLNNEVLIAAMYQTNTSMPVGEPDAIETAHKILSRLTKLRVENEALVSKATGAYSAQLELELDNMRRELAQSKKLNH